MDNRFSTEPQAVENGGMFSREQIQALSAKMMQIYSVNNSNELQPPQLARSMIDNYRGMNKHFIPTGYELSSFARVFDRSRKGTINHDDILATATRMFLASNKNTSGGQLGSSGGNPGALRPF